MKTLSLEEIRGAVHGVWRDRGAPASPVGISTDTRTARRGELYVALRGPRFDGHDFLRAAAGAGCCAAVVAQDARLPDETAGLFPGGILGVADTLGALGELAGHYRRKLSATVIAVTGSNGKTTTKRMIHHVLSSRRRGSCSPKSFNNQIGVPLTLLAVEAEDDFVVCELGTNAPGEIAALSALSRPDIAVITSVGPTHLEQLGSVQGVAAEKASILGYLSRDGVGVVWADSPELEQALKAYPCRLIRFGSSERSDLRLTGYQPEGAAQRFQINGRLWARLSLPGRHNAMNALAAIAVAQRMGFAQEEAAEVLGRFEGTDMRLELLDCGGVRLLNDAYNANPASVAAAAEVLAEMAARRRVLVLGDMRELGSAGPELHQAMGRSLAARGFDLLIGVGPLGRYIATSAAQAGAKTKSFETVEEACAAVPRLLRRGDLVLLKGSRSMQMERLVDPIRLSSAARTARAKGRSPKGRAR